MPRPAAVVPRPPEPDPTDRMPLVLKLQLQARDRPNEPAVVDGEVTLTYQELDRALACWRAG